jgi:hypothetical protein
MGEARTSLRIKSRSILNRFLMAAHINRRIVSFAHRAYSHDPHEHIDSVGGYNSDKSRWRLSQAAVVAAIETGLSEFLVVTKDQSTKIVIVTHGGQKYLKTELDAKTPDTLLALPMS